MAIHGLVGQNFGDGSWGVKFTAENEGGFYGSVAHAHIKDTSIIDELAAIGVGALLAQIAAAAAAHFEIMFALAKNSDGSWEFFHLQGSRKVWWWWEPCNFLGFVSDFWYTPAVSVQPGSVGTAFVTPLSVYDSYRKKAVCNRWRTTPHTR